MTRNGLTEISWWVQFYLEFKGKPHPPNDRRESQELVLKHCQISTAQNKFKAWINQHGSLSCFLVSVDLRNSNIFCNVAVEENKSVPARVA